MKVAGIRVDKGFVRGLKSLPPDRARAAVESLKFFESTPDLPRLRYRPLQGLADYFINNGKHGDRIILERLENGLFAAVDIGPHDNIYRRWSRVAK